MKRYAKKLRTEFNSAKVSMPPRTRSVMGTDITNVETEVLVCQEKKYYIKVENECSDKPLPYP